MSQPAPSTTNTAASPDAFRLDAVSARQTRLGLALFAGYCLFYGIFMLWASFAPDSLAWETPLGPNLAICYGIGLIVGAIVIAFLYMFLSRNRKMTEPSLSAAQSPSPRARDGQP
ncbi:MAG: DUF485 domain-containing protein [Pirellulales bacterium]|nr:DUF485 domain-containing protein [Pirellulales bacterium]